MGTVIKGAKVVTAAESYEADVRIEGETIAAIGKDLETSGSDEVIDANGRWLIPGGIDPHVHLELPFMGTVSKDDFDSGGECALAGGTTSLIDFAIPNKGDSMIEALKTWDKKAKPKARCDFSYHAAVTDWNDQIAEEIPQIVKEHGINSFKIFLAYMGVFGVDDQEAFKIVRAVKRAGGIVAVHGVNGDVLVSMAEEMIANGQSDPIYHALSQPPSAEGEATGRIIRFTEINEGAVYIVHVTAKDAIHEIAQGRSRGRGTIYGETCTQYLFLTQDLYELPDFEGAKYVLSPPLRPHEHTEELWRALADHRIETIGTDHCAFDFKGQKDMGRDDFRQIPNGFNGIEERLAMIYSYGVKEGRLSPERWVELCSTNAAKIFGMYPRKGTIAIGSDADLVLWNPDVDDTISVETQKSKSDYNVYEGYKIRGRASETFLRGKLAFKDGEVLSKPGEGQFLKRTPFNAHTI